MTRPRRRGRFAHRARRPQLERATLVAGLLILGFLFVAVLGPQLGVLIAQLRR